MKKILVTAVGVVMALCMVACGNEQGTMTEDVETEVIGAETSEAPVEETETIGMPTEAEPEEDTGEKAKVEVSGFDTSYNIEETVLVDENDVKITATGLTYTDYAVEVNLLLENNSDKNLSIYTGSIGYSPNAVNGYMLGGYMNAEVAAGKKTNETISYDFNELAVYGITKIADLQIGFAIKDEEYEGFETGPRQVKTAAADSYDYSLDTYAESVKGGIAESIFDYEVNYFAEDVLYEQNDVSVVSQALMTNKDGEQAVFLEVVNDSEETVYVAGSSISLNGLIVSGRNRVVEMICPGMRKVIQVSVESLIDAEYLELLGISEIGNMSVNLALKDVDLNVIAESQEISIAFSENVPMFEAEGTEVFNSEGIRVVSKGIVEDSEEYADYVYMILLAENATDESVRFNVAYNSLSVNGFMLDEISDPMDILPGKEAFIDIWVRAEDLEVNGITAIEDITEAEFGMEVQDEGYDMVAEATVKISY